MPITLEVEGPMAEYVTIPYKELILNPRETKCIQYNINFPKEISIYGSTTTKIWAKQKSSKQSGTFQILTNIHHKLNIFSPYPDKYADYTIEVEDVNINEPIQFKIIVKNYGQETIKKANVKLDIYGADDYSNFIETLYTDTKAIESMQNVNFFKYFETKGLKPGYYQVYATLYYDGESSNKNKIFKIGTLLVNINNYTKQTYAGKINSFEIDIESRWNNVIDSIYGTITIEGLPEPIITPTKKKLNAWEKTTLKAYLDLSNIKEGTYPGKINLFYENETNSKKIMIEVLSGVINEIPKPIIDDDIKTEQPTEIKNESILTITNILLLAIIILIIVDLVYLLYKKRKKVT